MRSFCYFRTPNAEKGNIMATTNETMKVIAEGIDQKKSPDIIMDGRVIVIEIPEEMEEIIQDLAWSLVKECDKTYEKAQESEIDEKDEDWVDNETGELASRIAAVLAHRAVENLMTIAENLTVETMVAITKYLLSMDAERLVSMLKGLFLSHGMYEAAGELDLLDICSEFEEDAVCFFEEAFYDTDSMDWYSIEGIIRDRCGNNGGGLYE